MADPHDAAEVHIDLGTAYAEMGLFSDAVLEFERAIELDPSSGRARAGLGAAQVRLEGGIPDEIA